MNNKLLLILLLFSITLPILGQSIVSTTPQNRKAILEEFTGINCTFCPQGHQIANAIKQNNPDNFFVINIHQGGFSTPSAGQPDFRTEFGTPIVNQSFSGSGFGYPSGTVNRTNFPGREMTSPGTTAMNRGNWTISSNQTIALPSYVNVGLGAEINIETRILTVTVEVYYTANSPETSNRLNIALLQNNTLGPQVGGNMGSSYPHMHRLVHMLTGQWGQVISTTSQGTLIQETFNYTIPEDYNNIPVDLFTADMEVVAFVAETTQKIISGNGVKASLSGLQDNDLAIQSFNEIGEICEAQISPIIKIQNRGTSLMTASDIQYSVNNGEPQIYEWSGSLVTLESEEIELPILSFSLQQANTLSISLEDDDNNSNNEISAEFNLADIHETMEVDLEIRFDQYPQETTWNITNSAGDIVHSGGPYPGQPNQTVTQTLALSNNDCYIFSIFDEFGDGICCQYGQGFYELKTDEGVMVASGGQFQSSESKKFSNYNTLSSEGFELFSFTIYPNPSNGVINFVAEDSFDILIYNIQGKKVFEQKNLTKQSQISLTQPSGMYIATITSGNKKTTQKLIIK